MSFITHKRYIVFGSIVNAFSTFHKSWQRLTPTTDPMDGACSTPNSDNNKKKTINKNISKNLEVLFTQKRKIVGSGCGVKVFVQEK